MRSKERNVHVRSACEECNGCVEDGVEENIRHIQLYTTFYVDLNTSALRRSLVNRRQAASFVRERTGASRTHAFTAWRTPPSREANLVVRRVF
jgi:hypothetical protein